MSVLSCINCGDGFHRNGHPAKGEILVFHRCPECGAENIECSKCGVLTSDNKHKCQ